MEKPEMNLLKHFTYKPETEKENLHNNIDIKALAYDDLIKEKTIANTFKLKGESHSKMDVCQSINHWATQFLIET